MKKVQIIKVRNNRLNFCIAKDNLEKILNDYVKKDNDDLMIL